MGGFNSGMPLYSKAESQERPNLKQYLKNNRLVVFLQIERKDVGEHESLSTLAQHVNGFLQELDLDPRHVVTLHVLHLYLHRLVQL